VHDGDAMMNPNSQPTQREPSSLRALLGKRIRELRKVRGWSQRELAARANLDHAQLSKYENGTHLIPVGALIRIARAFGLLVDVLLPDEHLPPDAVDTQIVQKMRRLATLHPDVKVLACVLLDTAFAMNDYLLRALNPASRR
jgi:transcriptional regulator with XRE-family HTH domain